MPSSSEEMVNYAPIPLCYFKSQPSSVALDGMKLRRCVSRDGKNWLEGSNVNHPVVEYKSDTMTEPERSKSGFGYMVAVVYPEGSGKAPVLLETEQFNMRQSVNRSMLKRMRGEDEGDAATVDERTGAQKRWDLLQSYGAARKKRELNLAASREITSENFSEEGARELAASVLNRVVELRGENAAPVNENLEMMKKMLPTFDLEATSAEKIYDLKSIVPDAALQEVDGSFYAEFLASNEVPDKKAYPEAICYAIENIRARGETGDAFKHKGKQLQVLHWFLDTYKFAFIRPEKVPADVRKPMSGFWGIDSVDKFMHAFSFGGNSPRSGLLNHWFNAFHESGASRKFDRKKVLSYLCVWYLSLYPGYKASLQPLAVDLKDLRGEYVPKIASFMGCRKVDNAKDMWALKAPLKVPAPARNVKRAKKN